jgi:hypothetical protein
MEQKQFPPLQRHPSMSDEAWQDYLEERKAFAKRLFKQSGGRLDDQPLRDYLAANNS